jgi:hypothetical protein
MFRRQRWKSIAQILCPRERRDHQTHLTAWQSLITEHNFEQYPFCLVENTRSKVFAARSAGIYFRQELSKKIGQPWALRENPT